ncbi:universal stress protein [Algibacter mikhailovii]|uniref:Universal stress protein UspA n=1 Tax=Algibacter mikhailovii TaxID=425498 RepID=A0A918R941_9FLAO|nr:universal stress protein [Algibacter mikhailovii]GGZ90269.1 universal stress protein UspA [Algibacter mikhailovii]
MKNILLPTDFSKNSLNAIHFAIDLFKGDACKFYLLNVQKASSFISDDMMAVNSSATIYKTIINAAKKSIENIILNIETNYPYENFEFYSIVDYDNFIDAINQITISKQIDLIIMGTKGASGLAKTLFGSNTVRVIQRCTAPVLVIPDNCKHTDLNTIAFTTNNLPLFNLQELEPLKECMDKYHAKLKILHVADEHHLAQNQSRNKIFFETHFTDATHDFIDSNAQDIFYAVQHYLKNNDVKLLAMMSKKHSFIERLFTRHLVETFAFKIDIPFLVMHSQSI